MKIKAVTIWQPWASLIAWGEKRFETRSWPTKYRGLIAIHAAKRWGWEQREVVERRKPYIEAISKHISMNWEGERLHQLPLGHVVAVAKLVDVYKADDVCYLYTDKEKEFGDFRAGRYAWRLEFVTPIDPTPAKGAQGLWWWQVPPSLTGIVQPLDSHKI